MPSPRPNILFLMSDQHRWDVAGFNGNKIVRTPTLDRLARDGVVFENAYTPSPVCIPARQCIAMGQLPATCGVTKFGQDLPPFSRTFARVFSEYAYETVVCGKLHHTGMDQNQGWRQRIGWDSPISGSSIPGYRADEAVKSPAQGWSWPKEIGRAGVGHSPHLKTDEMAVWGACEYLTEHFASPYYDRENHHPLLLMLGLRFPHYPYQTTEELFTYYLNRVEPYADDTLFDHPALGVDAVRAGDVSPRDLRRAIAAYYGMVEQMDGMLARVLSRLEVLGQNLDDWLIVYTSDHGEMLGEHSVWMKYKFFEGSVKVPLIVRWPRMFQGARRLPANVNLCDLYATFCDGAGLEIPEDRDSRSLLPLLRGTQDHFEPDETVSQLEDRVMVKRGALKYQDYGENTPAVLFDLDHDPAERANLIGEPRYAHRLEEFRARAAAVRRGGRG